jgi:arylsulfatase
MQLLRKIVLLYLPLLVITACEKEVQQRPNILLIMVDDMGYSDLGFCGSGILTPHIDRLAEGGLVFSQFYNTSRCCPSRAALLTGLYQHQTGVGDMNGDRGHPSYRGFLNDRCLTLAELLREEGYRTLMSGKWHLGNHPEHWPTQRGFDRFYGVPEGGGVYFHPFIKPRNLVLDDSILVPPPDFYSTRAFNRHALEFVDEALQEDTPFFLYLAHIAPHFPLQAPEEDYRPYLGQFRKDYQSQREERLKTMKDFGLLPASMELSEPDERVEVWASLSEEEKDQRDLEMAIYAAQLSAVDEGVGDLLALLKKENALENTIILFLSDNGACHEYASTARRFREADGPLGSPDSYRAYHTSWAHVSNTPFRMYKHWVHEGGIASPLIVSYPALARDHRVDHSLLHIMDIVPTLLELVGSRYPENETLIPLEGRSFLPLISGEQRAWERGPLFWEHEGNRAAREDGWKIVSTFEDPEWKLYHVEENRLEEIEMGRSHPDIKESLILQYEAWAERTGVLPREVVLNLKP